MTRTTIAEFFLVSGIVFGQGVSCLEPAEVHNLTLKQVQARVDAGTGDFFLYKRLLDLTPDTPKAGTLEPLFEKKLKEHPDDPRYVYLYGRSMIGKQTPDAIAQLRRVVELAPDFPWTYLEFARIYSSRNFVDGAKFAASLHTYRELCPASLEGYNWARSESEAVKNAEWAKTFRTLLEKNNGQTDHLYWTDLWATEFRLAPKSDYDELRRQVAEDLKRLESTPEPRNRRFLADLSTGYRLTERPEIAERIEQRLDPSGEFHKASQAFSQESHWSSNLSPEARETAIREMERLDEQWVVKWPQSSNAWAQLLMSLPHKPDWTKEEMEHAGLEVLRTDAGMEWGWTYISEPLRVAQRWVRYGIRLQDCVAIAEQALDQISLGPEVRSDLNAPPNEKQIEANELFGFNVSLFDAMSVIADGSAQLKDFDKARNMIARMQTWFNDNQALADNRSSGFSRFRGMLLNSQGRLAEAEDRKMDALAFYTNAIATAGRFDDETSKHASALWDESGGTKEGWELLTARPAPAKIAAALKPAVTAAFKLSPWNNVNKPLKEMNLQDVAGRTWTLKDFRGKTTLVTVWATWCGPCRDELPSLQKLYEIAKNRNDIQVITLNFDDDPGLVGPFLAAYHYTFPVLMSAREYAASLATGDLVIPQNWRVDQTLILREKSAGFDSATPDWPKAMLEKLTAKP